MRVPVRTLATLGVMSALLVGAACSTRLLTRFPHQLHLSQLACGGEGQPACLSCTSCHTGAPDQATWVKPPATVCAGCHHEEEAQKYARVFRPEVAKRPAAYDIRFGHDAHLKLADIKGQCVKCHAGVVQAAGGQPLFPPMDTCRGCHNHEAQFAANDCAPCHKESDLRGLKPLSFLPHDANWLRRHGGLARDELARCSTCHAQTQCDSCHDATQALRAEVRNPGAIEREYVHRFEFLSRHGIEARTQPGTCVSCHRTQDCDACHARQGVSGGLVDGSNPHPPNWAGNLGLATNLHGRAARRDIASCAACHEQGAASNCVRCHRVGGFGGNPHPPGWRSSQGMDAVSCAACHGGAL